MPKLKLTKSAIEALPYTAKGQVLYCDTDLPGFYLIVGSKSKTFAAQKDIQGRSVRYTIGKYGHFTLEEARKAAKEKLYHMSLGIAPAKQEKDESIKDITLEQVFIEYVEVRHKLKPRTRTDYQRMLDSYLGDWKNTRISEITKDMIAKRHAKLAADHGTYPANKMMRILRALFNYAMATYDLPANPVLYLTRVKAWYKETRRRTYIKPTDLGAWWDGVHGLENDTYRDFFLLLLFTGLRRGEAARIKWADVNFRERSFTIEDTKNGDPLTLPLSDYLHDTLKARHERYGNNEYVFVGTGKGGFLAEPKKGVKKVVAASGVAFYCHDLRRTFITIAESLDISSYALKRLINHHVTDVTGGYIIVDVERLRAPTKKIADFILEKVHADV